ncbi:MAG TPA: hypothetical protein VEL74_21660 [Thermoanaerobaculia bacterium]|nr:hypothetical protein [Thermoanaerobaculia bacterium]
MKKLYVGTVLTLALLFAPQMASAQTPCTAVCQAHYPCDYSCDLCVGDPGLWEDGSGCWGEIVSGTCGDIGQCGWVQPPTCTPNWIYDEISHQGAIPELTWDPVCEWQWNHPSGPQYVCDYDKPFKCTVYGVNKYVRHQDNCSPSSSQTFCGYAWQSYVGHYSNSWSTWECCLDSYEWNCTTSFPQCGW